MQTYPIVSEGSTITVAFEIDNVYVTPKVIARLLSTVDRVTDVRARKAFSSSADVHVQFKYCDRSYMVWEPYGDSSRYWIGPQEPADDVGDVTAIERVFKSYRPPLHRQLVGNILTFRWFTRLLGRPPAASESSRRAGTQAARGGASDPKR